MSSNGICINALAVQRAESGLATVFEALVEMEVANRKEQEPVVVLCREQCQCLGPSRVVRIVVPEGGGGFPLSQSRWISEVLTRFDVKRIVNLTTKPLPVWRPQTCIVQSIFETKSGWKSIAKEERPFSAIKFSLLWMRLQALSVLGVRLGAVSDYQAKCLRREVWKKGVIETYKIPPRRYSTVQRRSSGGTTVRVAYVGNTNRYKRVEDLIDACSIIERWGSPCVCEFFFPSGDRIRGDEIRRRAEQKGIRASVRYGYRGEEVWAAMHPEAVVCLPSVAESFGLPVYEALLTGRSVCAAELECFSERIRPLIWLFPARAVDRLAHHVYKASRSQLSGSSAVRAAEAAAAISGERQIHDWA